MTSRSARSGLKNEYNKLFEEALKKPGVREISKLYEDYSGISKQIESLSTSINPTTTIITSNSSS